MGRVGTFLAGIIMLSGGGGLQLIKQAINTFVEDVFGSGGAAAPINYTFLMDAVSYLLLGLGGIITFYAVVTGVYAYIVRQRKEKRQGRGRIRQPRQQQPGRRPRREPQRPRPRTQEPAPRGPEQQPEQRDQPARPPQQQAPAGPSPERRPRPQQAERSGPPREERPSRQQPSRQGRPRRDREPRGQRERASRPADAEEPVVPDRPPQARPDPKPRELEDRASETQDELAGRGSGKDRRNKEEDEERY